MRGGLVALGVIFVFIGLSWWVIITIDNGQLVGRFVGQNVIRAVWLVCMLPLALCIMGGMIFVAGLVGKSRAELEAARRPYVIQASRPPLKKRYQQPPEQEYPPPRERKRA